jgi:hypothetical protein
MKRKHAEWDIKEVFDEYRIPNVDITRNVMEKIYRDTKERGGFFVKYKVSIVICLGLLLIGTTGFAAMKAYQLKNEEGRVIYQEKDAAESGTPVKSPDEEMQAFLGQMTEIEEQLQPGTAVAAYIKENNPKKRVVTLSKPFIYRDLPSLQKKLGNRLIVKAELPGGFVFDGASVAYEVKRDYQKEELYALAEKSNTNYVVKSLSFTDSLQYMDISYRKGNDLLLVKVTPFDDVANNTLYQAGMDQRKTEKIKLKNTEALYFEEAGNDGVVRGIRWVQKVQGSQWLFMVETRAKTSNKDGMTKVMESLLGNEVFY